VAQKGGSGAHGNVRKASEAANVDERRGRVATLLLAGATYKQIGKSLGVHVNTVYTDVKAIRAEWRKERVSAYDEICDQECKRLDTMLLSIWDQARQGDIKAIETALKIGDQRARLMGLGTPASQLTVNLNVGDPLEALESKWRETLAARSLSGLAEVVDDGASPLVGDTAERRAPAVGEVVDPRGSRLWKVANRIGMGEGTDQEVPAR
jgi:hypothetical protein